MNTDGLIVSIITPVIAGFIIFVLHLSKYRISDKRKISNYRIFKIRDKFYIQILYVSLFLKNKYKSIGGYSLFGGTIPYSFTTADKAKEFLDSYIAKNVK